MKIIGEQENKLDERGKTLQGIADDIFNGLKEQEITIGELERIIAYLGVKTQNEIKRYKENKFVSELK